MDRWPHLSNNFQMVKMTLSQKGKGIRFMGKLPHSYRWVFIGIDNDGFVSYIDMEGGPSVRLTSWWGAIIVGAIIIVSVIAYLLEMGKGRTFWILRRGGERD